MNTLHTRVLSELKRSQNRFVSGEEISNALNVSRTAVWKQIKRLNRLGYKIEAKKKGGYRFMASPDILIPAEITPLLETRFLGHSIFYTEEISSTQEKGKELAREGATEGTIIISEKQAMGRGRMGRGWYSPKGGIWISIIFRPKIAPYRVPFFTQLVCLACVQTIERGFNLKPLIKWPNDIMVSSSRGGTPKKLGGILTEMTAEGDRINAVVCGIGINGNNRLNRAIKNRAVSLFEILGRRISRPKFLSELLGELEKIYVDFCEGNIKGYLEQIKKRSYILGRPVSVNEEGRVIKGRAFDIDEDGALVVKTREGRLRRVLAGDVRLVPDNRRF